MKETPSPDIFYLSKEGIYYFGNGIPICPHTEVPLDEAVALCVDLFGGSFQELLSKLASRGYKLVKST